MLWYARLGHDPNWFKQHVGLESEASVIKVYEASVIPGLLQLPEYAHELLTAGGEPNVEELVAERMARQAILERDPPPLILVLLSENILRWNIGGSELMRKQLTHLLELSQRTKIGLRVVPRSAGAHPGLDGSFKIMTGAGGDVVRHVLEGPNRVCRLPRRLAGRLRAEHPG
jgi:hypothetical protein